MPDSAPISFPFFFDFFSSSSSPFSAARFVSTSSSRSYLLETFVDVTSPLRSVLLREVETIQSGSPYASNAGWGPSVGPHRRTAPDARKKKELPSKPSPNIGGRVSRLLPDVFHF